VLAVPLAVDEVRRRAAARPDDVPVCDLLLDQRVVAGIGNIYRAEAMFLCGVDPWTPHRGADLDTLVSTAARIMNAAVDRTGSGPWVYRRAGQPCRRCGTRIRARRTGPDARAVYWCPSCQPSVRGG
jgi:endonuclease VIII